MIKTIKKYPFTILTIFFYSLGYIAQLIDCKMSNYCFMNDYFMETGMIFYWFMMIACELYHNKGIPTPQRK